MAGKGEDHAQGLAERSLNTSVVHPSQGRPAHPEQGDQTATSHTLPENEQREGVEKADATRRNQQDSNKL